MPYQVSRTDTGQFVLTDPVTDTVVIDDDLAQGFAKLERVLASKPALVSAPPTSGADRSAAPASFEFRGGPRYTPILLAVVLPFAWLAVMYFALANLLSETALDRDSDKDREAQIEQLEREVQALRSEISGAPRTAKSKPKQGKAERQPTKDDVDAEDEPPPEAEQPHMSPKADAADVGGS